MKKEKKFNPLKDFYWLVFLSVLAFILVFLAFAKEANPEWKKYQRDFKDYLEEIKGPESASAVDISIKQIWLPELNRVDRCTSCHLGYDQPDLIEAPDPFKAHPDISPHSLEQLGCTICHGGQGYALKKEDAHGEIEHWEEPLMGRNLARKYGIKNETALIQINCNICHRHDEDIAGMDMINRAKNLMTQKQKCQTCHIIDGKGGRLSADLTFVGDKPAERFDFSQISEKLLENERPLSMLSWHFEHFKNPETVVQGSQMPLMKYSEEEAMSLAMLMMSWKRANIPVMLLPTGQAAVVPEEGETEQGALSQFDWGKELFENKMCSECHTIGGGVEIGPDLIGVAEKRGLVWLKKMIQDPEEMERTDSTAQTLYKEYEELGMATEGLSDEEVAAIIVYIQSFDKN